MTTDQINELLGEMQTRVDAATAGPWETRFMWRLYDSARKDPINLFGTKPEHDWPDAEFIAHARTDVPQLIALVRELVAEREQARIYAEHYGKQHAEQLNESYLKKFALQQKLTQVEADRNTLRERVVELDARVIELTTRKRPITLKGRK